MDKLKRLFVFNKKVFVFLFCLMIIGIIFGSSLPVFLNSDDKSLVSQYLSDFIVQVKSGCDSLFLLRNGLSNNGIFSFSIWLLGISIIGIPIVLFLFFFKCFIFGFSISSIIINYGFKGILFSFFYIFPHQVINLVIYMLITNYSLIFSFKIIGLIFKKNDFNISVSFNKYLKIFLVCLIFLFMSVLYESFVGPYVLSFIFKLLGLWFT